MKTLIKISMTLIALFFSIGSSQAQASFSVSNRVTTDSLRANSANRNVTVNRVSKTNNITSPGNRTRVRTVYPVYRTNVRDHRSRSDNQGRRFDEADALFGKRTNVRDHRNSGNKRRSPQK